ncbi:MAG: family transcriptional regulator, cyclic receptor protein [Desulfovibrionales bacterium]|jgi:CRP-like cAMP-binding protein|nr:family transcriptional regulator, cyclic receptor protein [Desulfovibrionales bacterium]
MIESSYLAAKDSVVAKFLELPIFKGVEATRIQRIIGLCKIRQYDSGEDIIVQGAKDHWMYILISGEIVVEKDGVELGALRRFGDVFGEMGVIDGSPRSATVRARRKAMCLALDSSNLDRLDQEDRIFFHAVIFRSLSEDLAERLRRMNEENVDLIRRLEKYAEKFGPLN